MTKEKAKKGFIVRALDTVERVGNGLPNLPDTDRYRNRSVSCLRRSRRIRNI